MTLEIKSRYQFSQTELARIGTSGCLFLVLCSIAEEELGIEVDVIDAYHTAVANGWMTSDCFFVDQLAFLEYYTGKKWTKTTYKTCPTNSGAYLVERWLYNNTNHFRRLNCDTYLNSSIVANGRIDAYYGFKPKE